MNTTQALKFVKETDWEIWTENERVRELLSQIQAITVESIKTELEGGSRGEKGVSLGDEGKMKVVVVGDGAVGKTCLLLVFAKGTFPTEYVPTVFENFTATAQHGGKDVVVHLWDTAGQEEYDRLRPLSYPNTSIVLLCYSVVSRASFNSILSKWAPEIKHYLPDVPTILVGLKTDMREKSDKSKKKSDDYDPVKTEEGEALAKKIDASRFFEVSAKTNHNVAEVFQGAIETVHSCNKPAAPAPTADGQAAPKDDKKAANDKNKKNCIVM